MSLPTPYYDHAGIVIYNCDCRDILPHLPKVDLVLTDPPYNCGKNYGAHTDEQMRLLGWQDQIAEEAAEINGSYRK